MVTKTTIEQDLYEPLKMILKYQLEFSQTIENFPKKTLVDILKFILTQYHP